MAVWWSSLSPCIQVVFDSILRPGKYHTLHKRVFYELNLVELCQGDKWVAWVLCRAYDHPCLLVSKAVRVGGLICPIFALDYQFRGRPLHYWKCFGQTCLRDEWHTLKWTDHVYLFSIVMPAVCLYIPAFCYFLHFLKPKTSIVCVKFIEEFFCA